MSADAIIGIYTVVVSAVVGVLGFGGKLVWDQLAGVSQRHTQEKVGRIDVLLKFYYQVMVHLRREQIIWDKIVALHRAPPTSVDASTTTEGDFGRALDDTNLQHHQQLQTIIMSSLVDARPRADLLALFLQYDEHVTLYTTLREIGRCDFPSTLGSPYPKRLDLLVNERIADLEAEREEVQKSRWWFFAPS